MSPWDSIKLNLVAYSHIINLIILFLVGSADSLTGDADVISGIYLSFSLYYLYKHNYLFQNRERLWPRIQFFNSLVIIVLVVFQAPLFSCPVIDKKDRFYHSNAECLILQKSTLGFVISDTTITTTTITTTTTKIGRAHV